jgi:cytochrome bd-type quinol oxidase subunit 2
MAIRRERLAARLVAETQQVNYAGAIISGLAVAIMFPLLWSQLALSKGYGLSVGATILGGIVGYAVTIGAGSKRGRALQQSSAILTILGILLAHFLILLRTRQYAELGLPDFGSDILAAGYAFPSYLSSLTPWNGLFLVLGVIWAYWVPHVRTLRD